MGTVFKGILHTFGMTGSLAISDYSELFGFGRAEGIKTQGHILLTCNFL